MLGFIRGGLEDFSISRERTPGNWGIPFPIAENGETAQREDGSWDPEAGIIYVWFDALINYITGAGFPDDPEAFAKWWPADLHVIGKDIARFHTIFWPAMLWSAGLEAPRQVWVHGWLLAAGGERMSKSRGNFLDPNDFVAAFGADGARYVVAARGAVRPRRRVSWDSFVRRYNADLANDFGNLVNRTVSMANRYLDGERPAPRRRATSPLGGGLGRHARGATRERSRRCLLHEALAELWEFVGEREHGRRRRAAVGAGQGGEGRRRGGRGRGSRRARRPRRGLPARRPGGRAVHAGPRRGLGSSATTTLRPTATAARRSDELPGALRAGRTATAARALLDRARSGHPTCSTGGRQAGESAHRVPRRQERAKRSTRRPAGSSREGFELLCPVGELGGVGSAPDAPTHPRRLDDDAIAVEAGGTASRIRDRAIGRRYAGRSDRPAEAASARGDGADAPGRRHCHLKADRFERRRAVVGARGWPASSGSSSRAGTSPRASARSRSSSASRGSTPRSASIPTTRPRSTTAGWARIVELGGRSAGRGDRRDRARLRPGLQPDPGPAREPAAQPRPRARDGQAGDPPLPLGGRARDAQDALLASSSAGSAARRVGVRRPAAGRDPLVLRPGRLRASDARPRARSRFSGLVFRRGEEATAEVAAARRRPIGCSSRPIRRSSRRPARPRGRNEPEWVAITAAWLAERAATTPDDARRALVGDLRPDVRRSPDEPADRAERACAIGALGSSPARSPDRAACMADAAASPSADRRRPPLEPPLDGDPTSVAARSSRRRRRAGPDGPAPSRPRRRPPRSLASIAVDRDEHGRRRLVPVDGVDDSRPSTRWSPRDAVDRPSRRRRRRTGGPGRSPSCVATLPSPPA